MDKLDGFITLEDWAEKNQKWKHDLNDKRIQLEALQNTEQKYYEEGVRIIETLKNAYELYIQQPVSEKRKMLDYLLSNVTLEDEKVSYDYNLPFSYFVNFSKSNKKYPSLEDVRNFFIELLLHNPKTENIADFNMKKLLKQCLCA